LPIKVRGGSCVVPERRFSTKAIGVSMLAAKLRPSWQNQILQLQPVLHFWPEFWNVFGQI
jgi:hypothetical protein